MRNPNLVPCMRILRLLLYNPDMTSLDLFTKLVHGFRNDRRYMQELENRITGRYKEITELDIIVLETKYDFMFSECLKCELACGL